MLGCGLESSGSRQGPTACFHEQRHERSDSIEVGTFFTTWAITDLKERPCTVSHYHTNYHLVPTDAAGSHFSWRGHYFLFWQATGQDLNMVSSLVSYGLGAIQDCAKENNAGLSKFNYMICTNNYKLVKLFLFYRITVLTSRVCRLALGIHLGIYPLHTTLQKRLRNALL